MSHPVATDSRPMCPSGVLGLALALVGAALAIVGSFSPAGVISFPIREPMGGLKGILIYGFTFILPTILGLVSSLLGGHALKVIESSEGRLRGDGPAVFAIFIGMFTVVVGSICIFAGLIYPSL